MDSGFSFFNVELRDGMAPFMVGRVGHPQGCAGSFGRSVNLHGLPPSFDSERGGFNTSPKGATMADTTSSSVSPFNFGTHAVRVVMQDGVVWFVAADVCEVLGTKNHRESLRHLDDDEKGVISNDTLGGQQKVSVVNESGLYALVLRSRKPEAKKFTKWVTSEVLPAIRKTGGYELPNLYKQQPGDKLMEHQQLALRAVLEGNVKAVPKEKQGDFMMKGWSKLKAHFGVTYRLIPAERFDEALSLLMRHVTEFTQPKPIEAPSFMGKRWFMHFDRNGREVAQALDWDDCILKYSELPQLLASNDVMVDSPLLADIATACLQRLARRSPGTALAA